MHNVISGASSGGLSKNSMSAIVEQPQGCCNSKQAPVGCFSMSLIHGPSK